MNNVNSGMEHQIIELEEKSATGKMTNKALRKAGRIPAVVCLKDGTSVSGSLPFILAQKLVSDYAFMTRVFKVTLGKKEYLCIPKEVQFHPVTDAPQHFDFKCVDLKDKVVVSVPTVIVGRENSVGIKRGGNVFVTSYNVKLETVVDSIPNKVEVDISDSIIGSKYYLSDLKIPNAKPIYSCLVARVSGRQKKTDQQSQGDGKQAAPETKKASA